MRALTVRIRDDRGYRFRERTGPHELDEVPESFPVVRPRRPRPMCGQPRFHCLVYHKVYHSLAYAYVGRHDTFVKSQDTLQKNHISLRNKELWSIQVTLFDQTQLIATRFFLDVFLYKRNLFCFHSEIHRGIKVTRYIFIFGSKKIATIVMRVSHC